ncbi:MAG: 5'/3'-nucleotidase SurE [Synergistales bacterium]|nr:5'/3'-nucleotidase SurE [Synergistales bacterium]
MTEPRPLLLTNDDGVTAPGLVTLAAELADASYAATVVAPDRERSSIGHSITLTHPIRFWQGGDGLYGGRSGVYACDGTPSDCVVIGLEEVAPESAMVVSGINRGPNLGDDLTYSGTVSAAMEGVILGRPAIAVSLCIGPGDSEHRYGTAAAVVRTLLAWTKAHPLPQGVLLNVNVPNRPPEELQGILPTRKGRRIYVEKLERREDPRGTAYFWLAGRPEDELVEGTDVWAVEQGYVSVTPVHMDLTHYPTLDAFGRDFPTLGGR